jgi:hypothetical protein
MSTAVIDPDVELRFPVGRFQPPQVISPAQRSLWIAEIAALPANLQQAVAGLRDSQLDTPYRPGGWTVRQVTHHLADSHINSYCRFRLALTEHAPVIKPYDEAAWAELPDAKTAPLAPSLDLLSGLHRRWTILLTSLDDAAFARPFTHPEMGEIRIDWTLGLYAWHSRHHVAHINALRRREGW